MLPYININFSLSPIHLHTYSTMLWAYLSIAGFILFVRWNKSLGLRETCSFLFGIVFFGLLGARLMHCLWEAPQYYLEHPERILTSFNGMTFYGSFFLALPYTLYFIRRWRAKFSENEVSKTVSDFLIVLSLGYAILRIGCFLNGCCWGRITGLPWAVVYTHSDSAMPMLGIPVHPVQLYESALAFVLSGILISLRFFSNQIDYYSGLAIFFILHPISRFATEYFRADDFRGVYRFGLSTSQVLSILLFLGGIMFLFSKRKNHEKNYLTLSLLFLVCACGEIKAPGPEIVVRTQETDLGSTVYSMRFQYDRHRNAIYIAVDNQVQKYFDKQAVDFFGENPPRIEELSWWIYAKPLRRIYDDILVIPYNRFSKESLYEALEYMESKNETYDLYLMTHGIHNHITTSKGYDMLSYEDIDELKGSLAYLNLVYMQSCFGSTLSQDWLDAGANYVISYPDFNRNFFYLEFFLDQYGPQRKHPDKAYERTNKALYRKMKNNPLYAQLLEAMDLSLEDYEEMSEYPEFFSK